MGIFKDSIRGPTTNNTHVNNNLLVYTWKFLKPTLSASTESVFNILRHPKKYLRKSPLSMDKYYKSLCSYELK